MALGIGVVAGALCVFGYAVVQARIKKVFGIVDTCGVHNLHGMPGILGGLMAVAVVPGAARAQLTGIAVTVVLALAGGFIGGYIIRATGDKRHAYDDAEEFAGAD